MMCDNGNVTVHVKRQGGGGFERGAVFYHRSHSGERFGVWSCVWDERGEMGGRYTCIGEKVRRKVMK